jgi:hypothetical protein
MNHIAESGLVVRGSRFVGQHVADLTDEERLWLFWAGGVTRDDKLKLAMISWIRGLAAFYPDANVREPWNHLIPSTPSQVLSTKGVS